MNERVETRKPGVCAKFYNAFDETIYQGSGGQQYTDQNVLNGSMKSKGNPYDNELDQVVWLINAYEGKHSLNELF